MADVPGNVEAVPVVTKAPRGPRASTSSKNRTERSPSPYRSRNGQSTSELYVVVFYVVGRSSGYVEEVGEAELRDGIWWRWNCIS